MEVVAAGDSNYISLTPDPSDIEQPVLPPPALRSLQRLNPIDAAKPQVTAPLPPVYSMVCILSLRVYNTRVCRLHYVPWRKE